MTSAASGREPLRWTEVTPPGGTPVEQAAARNNSWYLIVPAGNAFEARYASQSANALLGAGLSRAAAKVAAEAHADRYDTRA